MSTPLDDETKSLLSFLGLQLEQNTISVICESLFWAVYVVFFAFALRIQISRGLRTWPTIFMLVVTILLFLSSSSLWAMNVSVYFIVLKGTFNKYPDLTILDRIYQVNDDIVHFGLPMETLFLMNMLIGDAIVIWRAWVLWQGGKLQRLVYIPMAMLAICFVFAVIALDCLASESYATKSTIPGGSRVCQWGEPIAWGISLLTNVTSTTLIAIKAWQHRQFLKSGMGRHHKSRSEKVLVLLVESGFIYCLFWLSQIILFFDIPIESNAIVLYMVLSTLGDQISGLYPTLIIVLVNMQRSISNETNYIGSMVVDSSSGRSPYTPELSTLQFNPAAQMGSKSVSFPLGVDTTRTVDMTDVVSGASRSSDDVDERRAGGEERSRNAREEV